MVAGALGGFGLGVQPWRRPSTLVRRLVGVSGALSISHYSRVPAQNYDHGEKGNNQLMPQSQAAVIASAAAGIGMCQNLPADVPGCGRCPSLCSSLSVQRNGRTINLEIALFHCAIRAIARALRKFG